MRRAPEASLAPKTIMPSTSGNAVGQKRRRSARVRGLAHGATSQRMASAPIHVAYRTPNWGRVKNAAATAARTASWRSTVGRSSAIAIA